MERAGVEVSFEVFTWRCRDVEREDVSEVYGE